MYDSYEEAESILAAYGEWATSTSFASGPQHPEPLASYRGLSFYCSQSLPMEHIAVQPSRQTVAYPYGQSTKSMMLTWSKVD